MGALTIPAKDWQAADWQRLWISIWGKRRPWRTLALVPAGPGVPSETMMHIAVTLANAGSLYSKRPIHVADASGMVSPSQVETLSSELARYVGESEHVIVLVPALGIDGTARVLARAADCALLCIMRGAMSSSDARKTITEVGRKHFLGSALFQLATAEDVAPQPKL